MKAFTPGPWTFTPTTSTATPASVIGAKNGDGFTPWVCHMQSAEVELANANARLIAAAPDMLEALQGLLGAVNVRIDDPRIGLFDACRAAIAKATGDAL